MTTPNTNQFHKKLNDSTSLTDVLIQMEDFLDGLDVYVFKNWFDGEVVKGPDVRRYWVSMTLKYEYEQMPDPDGAMRLVKAGAKVTYTKTSESVPRQIESPSDYRPDQPGKPIMDDVDIWLVEIQIPRRFIDELDDDDLDVAADDVDTDVVSDARDEDIDGSEAPNEDAVNMDDDGADDSSDDPNGGDSGDDEE